MEASRVRLGTATQGALYDGQVSSLEGNLIVASVRSVSGR